MLKDPLVADLLFSGASRAPFYPVFPALAFALGAVCLAALVWFNPMLTLLFGADGGSRRLLPRHVGAAAGRGSRRDRFGRTLRQAFRLPGTTFVFPHPYPAPTLPLPRHRDPPLRREVPE